MRRRCVWHMPRTSPSRPGSPATIMCTGHVAPGREAERRYAVGMHAYTVCEGLWWWISGCRGVYRWMGLMIRHVMNSFEEEVFYVTYLIDSSPAAVSSSQSSWSSSSHTSSSSSSSCYIRCQLLSVAKQWCPPRSLRCGATGSRPALSCS